MNVSERSIDSLLNGKVQPVPFAIRQQDSEVEVAELIKISGKTH